MITIACQLGLRGDSYPHHRFCELRTGIVDEVNGERTVVLGKCDCPCHSDKQLLTDVAQSRYNEWESE